MIRIQGHSKITEKQPIFRCSPTTIYKKNKFIDTFINNSESKFQVVQAYRALSPHAALQVKFLDNTHAGI